MRVMSTSRFLESDSSQHALLSKTPFQNNAGQAEASVLYSLTATSERSRLTAVAVGRISTAATARELQCIILLVSSLFIEILLFRFLWQQ